MELEPLEQSLGLPCCGRHGHLLPRSQAPLCLQLFQLRVENPVFSAQLQRPRIVAPVSPEGGLCLLGLPTLHCAVTCV